MAHSFTYCYRMYNFYRCNCSVDSPTTLYGQFPFQFLFRIASYSVQRLSHKARRALAIIDDLCTHKENSQPILTGTKVINYCVREPGYGAYGLLILHPAAILAQPLPFLYAINLVKLQRSGLDTAIAAQLADRMGRRNAVHLGGRNEGVQGEGPTAEPSAQTTGRVLIDCYWEILRSSCSRMDALVVCVLRI